MQFQPFQAQLAPMGDMGDIRVQVVLAVRQRQAVNAAFQNVQFIGHAGVLQGLGKRETVAAVVAEGLPDKKRAGIRRYVLFRREQITLLRVASEQVRT